MKKKLLITGASGFLGYHLIRLANADWDVYGFVNSNTTCYNKITTIQCDITDYIELGNLLEDIEPDAIIHAAAIGDANLCEQNPGLSHAVNVEASANLAGISSDYHIPFVFTSTGLVFDGTRGNYKEEDEKNAVSVYGKHKALAEDEILKIYPEALVLRLPLMFGSKEASATNYLQRFIQQAGSGESVPLFYDEYRSVCGAKSIGKGILQLIGKTTGIVHIAGPQRLSRYDFGLKAVKAFGINEGVLLRVSQKDVKMAANRPPDVSLNISKAIALGYSPLMADEELALIARNNYLD